MRNKRHLELDSFDLFPHPDSLWTTRERRPTLSPSRARTHTWILVSPTWAPSKTSPPWRSPWATWTRRRSFPSTITSWTCTRTRRAARRWARWRLETPTAGTVPSGRNASTTYTYKNTKYCTYSEASCLVCTVTYNWRSQRLRVGVVNISDEAGSQCNSLTNIYIFFWETYIFGTWISKKKLNWELLAHVFTHSTFWSEFIFRHSGIYRDIFLLQEKQKVRRSR